MRAPAAFVLLVVAIGLGGCKRARDVAGRFASNSGELGDTTVHFGQLDTSLLTNGSGWVRQKPGVGPDPGPPQQLQAPEAQDSAFSTADSAPSPSPARGDSAPARSRGRRDTLPDSLRAPGAAPSRQRRDSTPPRGQSVHPDTTVPDTTR